MPDTLQEHREAYLQDLRTAVMARSVWLMRDFISRHRAALGPVAKVLDCKPDVELRELLDEIDAFLRGESSHQLAAQVVAPWLVKRTR